jgi:carbamoyltransferase
VKVLGLSGLYHDSAAALLDDGIVVAAAQEERFTRKRHDASFPERAAAYCLRAGGVGPEGPDLVAFYDKPLLKFERLLRTQLALAPRGFGAFSASLPAWAGGKLWTKELIREKLGYDGEILFPEHHESHAASAFYPSPFAEAATLTMDGVGEWATTAIGRGDGASLSLLKTLDFPHSLGLLYSAFTAYLGFTVNSGEYKVMGLAPYGTPRFAPAIRAVLLDLKDDGSLRLNLDYFDFGSTRTMTNEKFADLLEGPARVPESPLDQRHKDAAASIQAVCEEVMTRMARHARAATGAKNLCLAGGVALNCVGNGRILRERIFDGLWIQPAAGDAGGALGAALFAWHAVLGRARSVRPGGDSQKGSLLGPEFSAAEIGAFLDSVKAPARRLEPEELSRETARLLSQGKVVGWFQGRMEFGPRALGARSILGDPRDPEMRSRLNGKIKFRESFRPFAPAVLAERAGEFFDLGVASPYMLLTAKARPAAGLPAVTHLDGSARVQTVTREFNPVFHGLLKSFEALTGCPVLVNTSFNVRGEPLVLSPQDAYACFLRTGMDALALGPYLLLKADQPAPPNDPAGRTPFALD